MNDSTISKLEWLTILISLLVCASPMLALLSYHTLLSIGVIVPLLFGCGIFLTTRLELKERPTREWDAKNLTIHEYMDKWTGYYISFWLRANPSDICDYTFERWRLVKRESDCQLVGFLRHSSGETQSLNGVKIGSVEEREDAYIFTDLDGKSYLCYKCLYGLRVKKKKIKKGWEVIEELPEDIADLML